MRPRFREVEKFNSDDTRTRAHGTNNNNFDPDKRIVPMSDEERKELTKKIEARFDPDKRM